MALALDDVLTHARGEALLPRVRLAAIIIAYSNARRRENQAPVDRACCAYDISSCNDREAILVSARHCSIQWHVHENQLCQQDESARERYAGVMISFWLPGARHEIMAGATFIISVTISRYFCDRPIGMGADGNDDAWRRVENGASCLSAAHIKRQNLFNIK